MQTITHTVGHITLQGNDYTAQVTLPAPPWGTIERDDRRDTSPNAPVIRQRRPAPAERYNAIGRAEV